MARSTKQTSLSSYGKKKTYRKRSCSTTKKRYAGVASSTTEYQTSRSNKRYDDRRKAKLPGKRVSASGRVYYERRKNRSDTSSERARFKKRR